LKNIWSNSSTDNRHITADVQCSAYVKYISKQPTVSDAQLEAR